jgi:hypothetical protein
VTDHDPQEPRDFGLAASEDGDVVTVTFSGRSTARNSRAMTARYFEILRAAGHRKALADIRQLQGRLSAGETFLLVHKLPLGTLPDEFRTAILEAPEQRAYAEFLETVLVNAGVRVKCTLDRDEALAWLRAQ